LKERKKRESGHRTAEENDERKDRKKVRYTEEKRGVSGIERRTKKREYERYNERQRKKRNHKKKASGL
jgi:hypothetical protein